MFHVARAIMGNEQDAEDAVQEIFERVLSRIGQFRYEASFSSWLKVLAANVCKDMLRVKKRHPTEFFEDLCAADEMKIETNALTISQEEELIMKELLENLHAKISRLKREHQRLIILRYIDGLSYRKISQLLDCSEAQVKSRLHQARKKLRRACQWIKIEQEIF
jgi:RNA polymerase sigma-70 factor (ECF subfamily)